MPSVVLGPSGGKKIKDADFVASDLRLGKIGYNNYGRVEGSLKSLRFGELKDLQNWDGGEDPCLTGSLLERAIYETDGHVTIYHSDVANAIGLTADKIVSGNTVLGVAGSASTGVCSYFQLYYLNTRGTFNKMIRDIVLFYDSTGTLVKDKCLYNADVANLYEGGGPMNGCSPTWNAKNATLVGVDINEVHYDISLSPRQEKLGIIIEYKEGSYIVFHANKVQPYVGYRVFSLTDTSVYLNFYYI